jgi:DNA-binding GntR family transcriptional regulator
MTIGVPAYEQLRDLLRSEIVSGLIPPGTRLVIADVAGRFGVSHMPVREAFQSLQGEGLVKFVAHRGAHASSLTPENVRDIYEVRGMIAGLLARQSIASLTPAVLNELETIQATFCEAVSQNNLKLVIEQNNRFHTTLYKLGKNREAQRTYQLYAALLGTLRHKYGIQPARLEKMKEEHSAILMALHSRDESLVEKLVKAHGEEAMNDILSMMQTMNTQ